MTITVLLGLITILAAWFGSSHTASLTGRMLWLNAAVAGFAVAAIGLGLWLMAGRRAVGERRFSLVSLEEPAAEPASAKAGRRMKRGSGETASLELVRVPGTRRVHAPDCPLVAGKQVEQAAVSETSERCGVCTP